MRWCAPQVGFIVLVMVLGVLSMLGGCGKKGPLYRASDEGRGTTTAGMQEVERRRMPKPGVEEVRWQRLVVSSGCELTAICNPHSK